MSSFLDKIVDQGKEILQDPSKINSYVEDPSKLLNVGLKFIGQDGKLCSWLLALTISVLKILMMSPDSEKALRDNKVLRYSHKTLFLKL